MNLQSDWRALSDRIDGFAAAAKAFLEGLGSMSHPDAYETRRKHLLPAARSIYKAVLDLSVRHRDSLPISAREAIERFVAHGSGLFTDANLDNSEALLATAVALGGFRAELQFLLSDRAAVTLRMTERAFVHLNRQIVADEDCRARWASAYAKGEIECERLGSVHLLHHGIWAFKVSADGGRTDLVFPQALDDLEAVARVADALVLTEWKLIRQESELKEKIVAARRQTSLYAAGVLGGLELAQYRYIVIVAERELHLPQPETEGGVEYRHVCIAVTPESPSVRARRAL